MRLRADRGEINIPGFSGGSGEVSGSEQTNY